MWDRYIIRRKMNSFSRRMGWSWAPALPIRAWISPTSRCNLECRTCPTHAPVCHPDLAEFSDMKPEVYERVRRELLPALQEICLSGTGEPFLAPIFYAILDDMLKAGKRIVVITNGTILRSDYIERLVHSPSLIIVSIDGTTPWVLEHIRPGARFERVLEFMKMVKEIRDHSAHPAFEFHISFVVMRSNVEQLADCVELAHHYDVNLVGFSNFITGERTDEFARESLLNRPEEVLPHWQRAHERGLELGICVPPIFFGYRDRAEVEQCPWYATIYNAEGRVRHCPIPWWSTFIETDGSVRPCCVLESQGNLLEQSFREIWNSPNYRRLRRIVNTSNMPAYCKLCEMPVRL